MSWCIYCALLHYLCVYTFTPLSPFYFFPLHCSLRDMNPRAEHSLSNFDPPMVVVQSKYTDTGLMECLGHGKNESRLLTRLLFREQLRWMIIVEVFMLSYCHSQPYNLPRPRHISMYELYSHFTSEDLSQITPKLPFYLRRHEPRHATATRLTDEPCQ